MRLAIHTTLAAFFLLFITGCVDKAVELVIPPEAPHSLSTSPVSPGSDATPNVSGKTTPESTVLIYFGDNCLGGVAGAGSSDRSGNFNITTSTLASGTYTFSAKALNSSGFICSVTTVNYILDTTVPTLTISAPSVSTVNSSGSVDYTVTYTAASVISLTSSDVSLTTTGTATCGTITVTNGTSTPANVELSGCTGNGTVRISIAAGTSTSIGGNQDTGAGPSATIVVDNSGIASATYNPLTGTYNTFPAAATITFPETYDGTSLDLTDFTVSGSCNPLPSVAITGTTGTTASISLSAQTCLLGQDATISLDLTGVNDAAGNPGSGTADATYTFDNIGPTSATYNPVASDVSAIPATVVITFSENIDTASVADADFSIGGSCTTPPSFSVTAASGATATLTLTGGTCSVGQTIIVGVDFSLIDDTTGNAGAGTDSVTYRFDNVGPVLTSSSPATADLQAIPASVDFVFDEDVLASSVVDGDLVVSGTCGTLPAATVSSVSTTTVTFGLSGAACAVGETVIVTLNGSAVTDPAGNAGSATSSKTYTFDNVGPVPAGTPILPATAAVNSVPLTVTLTFDEDLDPASVLTSDLSIISTCATPPTVTGVNVNNADAAFTLSAATCADDDTTTVTLNGSDVTDYALNVGSGSITATYTIDVVGPAPLTISPGSGPRTVMPTTIAVNFDESIAPGSVAAGDLVITGTCTTLPNAAVSTISGSTVNFTLSGSVCSDAQTFTLTVNGSDFTDLLANAGSGSQVVTYTKDSTGPSISSFSPATGTYTGVPATVTIDFSETLNSSSVSASDFTASGCAVQPTIGTPTVTDDLVSFSLTGGTCNNTQSLVISVVGAGITDPAGNTAGSGSATYTIDNAAPTVTSYDPVGGVQTPPASMQFIFSEDIDSASVTIGDFTMAGSTCVKTITLAGVVNNMVNINIAGAACATGQVLTINVSTGSVTDLAGNALSGSGSVTYTEP